MNGFTEAELFTLRTFWDDGLSTAEIGRRMGRTKNSIVGKAHRIGLEPRASPILRRFDDKTIQNWRADRVAGKTCVNIAKEYRTHESTVSAKAKLIGRASSKLPKNTGINDKLVSLAAVRSERPAPRLVIDRPPAPIPAPPPVSRITIPSFSRHSCQWPTGSGPYRFECDGRVAYERSYCDQHHRRSITKVQDEEAA